MSAAEVGAGPAPGRPPLSGTAPEPPYRAPSLRAPLVLLALVVLLAGGAYTAAVGGFAGVVGPIAPAGTPVAGGNASAIASQLIGQNISNASLFWLRPSLTDWAAATGSGESPFGPTDPALRNATVGYMALYGLANTTVPIDLVSPSESGIDPDLSPAAALAQVPRVAAATGLGQAYLLGFVQSHVQMPPLGFVGPPYVNVIDLDLALLAVLGR